MKKKIIKVISVFMVLNIFLIPLSNFAPGNQIKTVQAAEGVVDIRFYNAIVSLIGITAAGIAAMSPSFSIPEVDMIQLKDEFAQSLESDAAKKTAWMNAQADYLAGGIAKTMGAVELAKIGVNDIYLQFKNYVNEKLTNNQTSSLTQINGQNVSYAFTNSNIEIFTAGNRNTNFLYPRSFVNENYMTYTSPVDINDKYGDTLKLYAYDKNTGIVLNGGNEYASITSFTYSIKAQYVLNPAISNDEQNIIKSLIKSYFLTLGISHNFDNYITKLPEGNVTYKENGNIINSDAENINVLPTIPWVDTSIPIGTIVTPVISAPYAGTVPIDVPITVPIDPPIDVPVDPPVEPTLIGTVAAILAGLTPIAGFLEYILAGQVSLTESIEAGLTGVIDGIGDIAGTLTGGITSSLTEIQSSLSTLTAPATETINLDPVKNIPSVLFTKFPFSIPWDLFNVYNLMATDNRSPPEFSLGIPMTKSINLSSFGVSDIKMDVKLENYEEIAGIVRTAELLLFVIGLIFATKKLIWG